MDTNKYNIKDLEWRAKFSLIIKNIMEHLACLKKTRCLQMCNLNPPVLNIKVIIDQKQVFK